MTPQDRVLVSRFEPIAGDRTVDQSLGVPAQAHGTADEVGDQLAALSDDLSAAER